MKTMSLTLLPLALLLALPAGRVADTAQSERPVVHITNHGAFGADVFILVNDQNWRLGYVESLTEESARIPLALPPGTEMRVLVDPIGTTGAYLSDPVPYSDDETYDLTIENALQLSTFHPTTAPAS